MSSKKNIAWLVVGVIAIVGLIWFLASVGTRGTQSYSVSESESPPKIAFSSANNDWGEIDTSEQVAEVEVMNEGLSDLIIYRVSTSCSCTKAEVKMGEIRTGFQSMSQGSFAHKQIVIKPGEKGSLSVKYDPLYHGKPSLGSIKRSVYLRTNDPENPEAVVSFKARYNG
jgi:hypothetical protein